MYVLTNDLKEQSTTKLMQLQGEAELSLILNRSYNKLSFINFSIKQKEIVLNVPVKWQ